MRSLRDCGGCEFTCVAVRDQFVLLDGRSAKFTFLPKLPPASGHNAPQKRPKTQLCVLVSAWVPDLRLGVLGVIAYRYRESSKWLLMDADLRGSTTSLCEVYFLAKTATRKWTHLSAEEA